VKKTPKTVAVVYKSVMAARKDKMPSRNASRDREVSKQVVDSLNALDLGMPSGLAEIWKNKYFMEYKVGLMHCDAKYALCTACLRQKDYHLARICRGASKKERGTTNARQHLCLHHHDIFQDLCIRKGRMADPEGGSGHMNHHFASAPKSQGPLYQIESATLDSLVRLVVETLDPWDHINSMTLQQFAKSIHPQVWVPSVKTLLDHARLKATMCREQILEKIKGEVLTVALDTWTSAAGK